MGLNLKFWLNIFLAPWTIAKVNVAVSDNGSFFLYAIPSALSLILFVIFHIMDYFYRGCWAIAWVFYLCFVTIISTVRGKCREKLNITGNPCEDFLLSVLLYPNVLVQLDETTKHLKKVDVEMLQTAKENEIPA